MNSVHSRKTKIGKEQQVFVQDTETKNNIVKAHNYVFNIDKVQKREFLCKIICKIYIVLMLANVINVSLFFNLEFFYLFLFVYTFKVKNKYYF